MQETHHTTNEAHADETAASVPKCGALSKWLGTLDGGRIVRSDSEAQCTGTKEWAASKQCAREERAEDVHEVAGNTRGVHEVAGNTRGVHEVAGNTRGVHEVAGNARGVHEVAGNARGVHEVAGNARGVHDSIPASHLPHVSIPMEREIQYPPSNAPRADSDSTQQDTSTHRPSDASEQTIHTHACPRADVQMFPGNSTFIRGKSENHVEDEYVHLCAELSVASYAMMCKKKDDVPTAASALNEYCAATGANVRDSQHHNIANVSMRTRYHTHQLSNEHTHARDSPGIHAPTEHTTVTAVNAGEHNRSMHSSSAHVVSQGLSAPPAYSSNNRFNAPRDRALLSNLSPSESSSSAVDALGEELPVSESVDLGERRRETAKIDVRMNECGDVCGMRMCLPISVLNGWFERAGRAEDLDVISLDWWRDEGVQRLFAGESACMLTCIMDTVDWVLSADASLKTRDLSTRNCHGHGRDWVLSADASLNTRKPSYGVHCVYVAHVCIRIQAHTYTHA